MVMQAFFLLLHRLLIEFVSSEISFTYNGFLQANLSLDGAAPKYPDLGSHGFAFVFMSTKEPRNCHPNRFLGLPGNTSIANLIQVFWQLSLILSRILNSWTLMITMKGGISSFMSNASKPAAYYIDDTSTKNQSITLHSGNAIQAWIDYEEMRINVTISPLRLQRPSRTLISFPVNLSSVMDKYMYVSFSASTGQLSAAHSVVGWSLRIGGEAQNLDPSKLQFLVKPIKMKEVEYGASRFKYSELYAATRDFKERNVIGTGGFGKVYKGVLPRIALEVGIKRVAPDSRQGMKEFAAEITSMGRLRHRNLVQLHGWCRIHDEILLVYDCVTNGSLDKLLFDDSRQENKTLTWEQRYKIIIGVAKELLYLHEECYQMVVHRDVKSSYVLIHAKLGDFGLARTYNHGIHPQTTHTVGTLRYLAPELTRAGVVVQAVDPSHDKYNPYEVAFVLTLGLVCTHPQPECRPTMRRVVEVLLGNASLPKLPPDFQHEASGSSHTQTTLTFSWMTRIHLVVQQLHLGVLVSQT
ncbi:hypothetical protein ACH5RR_001976 [Cinchona calisaya]|uniref:non-specific serine/threonine protein kinase n=1 Tax=Cinchona calisaya TaxID=153742 RepID=A0ABD3B5I8_9GENT